MVKVSFGASLPAGGKMPPVAAFDVAAAASASTSQQSFKL